MSLFEYVDFSLCDPSSPLADEDRSIVPILEPLPNSSESHWSTGTESAGNNYSSLDLNVLEPKRQRSTSVPPLQNATVWMNDLIGSSSFVPLASEVISDVSKHFDGQSPSKDTYSADVKRYTQRTGKVPNINIFTPEDDDFDAMQSLSFNDTDDLPSTPIQWRVGPFPKPGKRFVSRSSSVTSSEASYYGAESSSRHRTAARREINSSRTVKIKALRAVVVLEDEPKDEPPSKKLKGRTTFNSACAADDLALFAPAYYASLAPSVVGPIGSPLTSLPDSSDPSSHLPKAITAKKRKLEEIDNNEDEFTAVKEKRKSQPEWEPVTESYSRQMVHSKWQYRCTACFKEDGREHLCTREGDMQRHLKTLRHTPKSFFCSSSGCLRSFTREDALKRHMIKCDH